MAGRGEKREPPAAGGALNPDACYRSGDAAVIALRHWVGRRADNLQLLQDFPADARRETETWEAHIGSLKADKAAIRALAYWHLYRLVPEGRKPTYNPAGDGKRREAAYEAWKKLVPDGQLPPAPRPAPK